MSLFSTPITSSGSSLLYLAHAVEETASFLSPLFPASAKFVLLTPEQHGTITQQPAASFDYVLARPVLPYSPPYLQAIFKVLKPGGSFILNTDLASTTHQPESELILSGFVDITVKKTANRYELVAQRPPWDVNAAAPLSFKKKNVTTTAAPAVTTASASSSVWNLAASDMNDLDVDLVGEDELLAKDKVVLPVKVATDCGTGAGPTKKACKNCSCGLAEQQAAEETGTTSAKPVSACGSCGLGDAFRCSTCPFLGKPAFSTSTTGAVKLAL